VNASRLAMSVEKGYKPTRADLARVRPGRPAGNLTAAERRRLGTAGVKNYSQWLAGVQANPIQYGLIKTQPSGANILGPAGTTGNVGPITINVSGAANPQAVAVAVRVELQRIARRNAKQTRGPTKDQKIGLR
jgi:hypothetical protein